MKPIKKNFYVYSAKLFGTILFQTVAKRVKIIILNIHTYIHIYIYIYIYIYI